MPPGTDKPIVGQGLSMAMRDARLISEALLDAPNWTSQLFMPYAESGVSE
jgi:hypothetical protein